MTQTWHDHDPVETQEWLDALASVVEYEGKERANFIISQLVAAASQIGLASAGGTLHTPFCNTLSVDIQPDYPGDLTLEQRIDAINRWNAIVMVLRAKKKVGGVGGHLASYASIATLYEVGLNHFFRGATTENPGDLVYFQGHSSEGNYARAFLEGRLSKQQLENFRQEISGDGLSSYPHPWLMPSFWQFATVSLGLGPLQAIYQARFLKYLESRGLIANNDRKVWVYCGDGEMDEVDSVGALTVATRENLDNIVYVVNCNLQRLDGLVRGNGKILQELEGVFRGAGWHVIKVVWDSNWDEIFARDSENLLLKKLTEMLDGEWQSVCSKGGAEIRAFLIKDNEKINALLADLSDQQLEKLHRGAHDPVKIYAAYAAATQHKGQPVAILAHGVKGYGLGVNYAEGRNIAHNALDMPIAELKAFCQRFQLSLSEQQIEQFEFYHPGENDPAVKYLQQQRAKLGGYSPARLAPSNSLQTPSLDAFNAVLQGTGDRQMSTTMVLGRIFNVLLKDQIIGERIVPIFSDEVRTFGFEALFRQIGIYAHDGQNYTPEDKEQLLYYREAKDGQLLQEGITEAGCMASWIAAATSYSTHHVPMIPFFTYYSMFGFQRVGDLIWAAGDMRARGFLIGATAGRTTLEGEGLQHQDGNSLLTASTFPACRAYDPAFGFEMAVLIQHGLDEMFTREKDVFYYLTAMNEKYIQPPMPENVAEGIVRGMYCFQSKKKSKLRVQLFGSGAILREVLAAAELLEQDFAIGSDVWSLTSYSELRREGSLIERENRLNLNKKTRRSYVENCLAKYDGPVIAASDYVRAVPDLIRPFISRQYTVLGTDGFGRSDTREQLRRFFEVDRYNIVIAALQALVNEEKFSAADVKLAIKKYGIDSNQQNPFEVMPLGNSFIQEDIN